MTKVHWFHNMIKNPAQKCQTTAVFKEGPGTRVSFKSVLSDVSWKCLTRLFYKSVSKRVSSRFCDCHSFGPFCSIFSFFYWHADKSAQWAQPGCQKMHGLPAAGVCAALWLSCERRLVTAWFQAPSDSQKGFFHQVTLCELNLAIEHQYFFNR